MKGGGGCPARWGTGLDTLTWSKVVGAAQGTHPCFPVHLYRPTSLSHFGPLCPALVPFSTLVNPCDPSPATLNAPGTPDTSSCTPAPGRYGPVKRYGRKPFASFAGTDRFLRIVGAVREGLLTMSMSVDNSALDDPKAEPYKQYCSCGFVWGKCGGGSCGQQWRLSRHGLSLSTTHCPRLLPPACAVAHDNSPPPPSASPNHCLPLKVRCCTASQICCCSQRE